MHCHILDTFVTKDEYESTSQDIKFKEFKAAPDVVELGKNWGTYMSIVSSNFRGMKGRSEGRNEGGGARGGARGSESEEARGAGGSPPKSTSNVFMNIICRKLSVRI